jgi:L-seryl-tRNA(Ser) seleniumtransferase
VAPPVFKTGEVEHLGLAGSIPVRLRMCPVALREGVRLSDPRRLVPRTDAVLADPRLTAAIARFGRARVKNAVTSGLQQVRDGQLAPDQVADQVVAALGEPATSLRRVINATGVVLHTNLGRAALSDAALEALQVAGGYVDVEYDLATGQRAKRGRGALAALQRAVPAAGDALIVNNGAAALVLATTALAAGREVVVSRGELVEIGDGFRLPDLITSTGATLREVGTTNRVTRADYAAAIGPQTGCILKVHPSNFRIEGFTSAVPVHELATLGVPVVADTGSGLLAPHPLLPDEPDVTTALREGADLVTASGDKLLGGPQAGLVLGRADHVQRLRRHPLARALRVDKLTLAALEATLTAQLTPSWAALTADPDTLRTRCAALADHVGGKVVPSRGVVGGGGAPGLGLDGWAVALPAQFAPLLRAGRPPVITRVEHDRCLIDLRCVPADDDATVRDAVARAVDA